MAEQALNQNTGSDDSMTDTQLVRYCKDEIENGIGGNATSIDSNIEMPLDYYFGRLPGLSKSKAKDKNASRYVSQDVMDGVEATVAEIMPAYVTDEIGFYEPEGEHDDDQARTESEIVNYLFMEEYDGYTLIQTALKDALLHRNCTAKAYWDERIEVSFETHENVPEMALPELLKPESEDEKIEILEQDIVQEADPTAKGLVDAAKINPDMVNQLTPGQKQAAPTILQMSQNHYDIRIKRTKICGRPVIENVPPENVIVRNGHNSPYLHNCEFVAERLISTRSDLIAQGFDKDLVESLPAYTGNDKAIGRSRKANDNNFKSSHKSMDFIEVFVCFPEIDFDGDGIAERRRVIISNDVLLDNEEWSGMPLVGGCVSLIPHKYQGLSMFDRLYQIQDAKTPVMRSIIDGTMLSSNPRVGVIQGKANIDDILTSRTGGVVRAERADAMFEVPNPQVPASSYTMLEFMDGVRRDRGGGAIDSSAQAQAISGDTAHGIERVMSSMEMNNALLARTLGETIVRGIFIELHHILRENYKGEVSAKIGGRWVTTVPSEWKKRTNVSIQVGSSHAERARQSNLLRSVIDMQSVLAEKNSPMFSEDKAYAAITDAVKYGGIKAPERYFIDPKSPMGQMAKQRITKANEEMKAKQEFMEAQLVKAQEMMAQAEMIKGQADMDANYVKSQNEALKNEISRLQTELKAVKDSADIQFKYDELAEHVALKLTEMEAKSGKELSAEKQANQPER